MIVMTVRAVKVERLWLSFWYRSDHASEGRPDRRRKEGNVLFNDTLNTFYFTVIWRRTYGKGPLR